MKVPQRLLFIGAFLLKVLKSHQLPLVTKLYGSIHSTAYYMADAVIGSSSVQRQSLIVDTGSSITSFGCEDCNSCGRHLDPLFVRGNSTSIQKYECGARKFGNCAECRQLPGAESGHCSYTISYLEGSSLRGRWYADYIWLGHHEGLYKEEENVVGVPFFIPFGCHLTETHLFLEQLASGILGLEFYTNFGPETFVATALNGLLSMKISNDNLSLARFAVCFSENGGVLAFGGSNTIYHEIDAAHLDQLANSSRSTAIQWTPLKQHQGYEITINGIVLSSGSLRVERSYQALVDSGTTVSYFPIKVYYQVLLAIQEELKEQRGKRGRRRLSQPSPVYLSGHEKDSIKRHQTVILGRTRFLDEPFNMTSVEKSLLDGMRELINQRQLEEANLETNEAVERALDWIKLQPSASRRSNRAIKIDNYSQEECWYLPDPVQDLLWFPDIIFELDGGSSFSWSPSSYLYTKGSLNIRCLAISPIGPPANYGQQFAFDSFAQSPYVQDIVLGSSFFINHDVIFDLSRSVTPPSGIDRLGYVKAACPEFEMEGRGRFGPLDYSLYANQLDLYRRTGKVIS